MDFMRCSRASYDLAIPAQMATKGSFWNPSSVNAMKGSEVGAGSVMTVLCSVGGGAGPCNGGVGRGVS